MVGRSIKIELDRNLYFFVMVKTYFSRDYVCFLVFIRNIGSTYTFYISEYLNNIFIQYKYVLSYDLPVVLSPKNQVDHKIAWKYINLQSSMLFGSKQIGRMQSSSERDVKQRMYSTKCFILRSFIILCKEEECIHYTMRQLPWIESANGKKIKIIIYYGWFVW